jgi:hypothetical protein
MRACSSAVVVAVVVLLASGTVSAQNWEVVVPVPHAIGCSEPDVLGDTVCIVVEAGPRVWMFGDTDGLWDTVAVSVDDGEVFVAVKNGLLEWEGAEAVRLTDELRRGSRAFVTTDVESVWVELSGSEAIDDVLARGR